MANIEQRLRDGAVLSRDGGLVWYDRALRKFMVLIPFVKGNSSSGVVHEFDTYQQLTDWLWENFYSLLNEWSEHENKSA